uniref:Peptidase C1A papain C-terminal domain-containing protein n=1 Tax=Cannabis sativa TaxID=3483 RepID=A0A803PLT4_CANSA
MQSTKLSHSKEQPKIQDNMAKDIIIIDWRKKMALPSIKNQGTAECCWAISSADAVASCKALRGTSVTLSPQHLIDVAYINHKVNGSFQVSWAMDFIRDSGPMVITAHYDKGLRKLDANSIYRPNYELEGDEDYGHAMLLVGEGVRLIGKDKIHFWIVQNSWGENWAENGFGKIVRNYELKVRGYYPILQ